MWEEDKKFLAEQVLLPREQWDKNFKQYVERKHRESVAEPEQRSEEEEIEWNFKRYLKSLDLRKEELIDKRILDLGSGEGDFIKYCLREGITQKVYGLDLQNKPEEISEPLRKYFLKGDFEKELPIKELDYIISVAGVEAPYSEEIERDLRKILVLCLTAIRHNGQIRIFPVRKAPPLSGLRAIDFSRKKWLEIIDRMALKGLIDYELRPIEIGVGGQKPDVWLEELLILKRKVDIPPFSDRIEKNKTYE